MQRPNKVKQIVRGLTATLSCPITLKMRTGWNERHPMAHNLMRTAEELGQGRIAAFMLHGRSRLQRYSKLADWSYIGEVAKGFEGAPAPSIPIIGNGDIFSHTEWEEHKAMGGISTCCMLARGALIKPWLPTEIKERRAWDISASERLDILRDFVSFGLEHWGSDQQGVNTTRRFLLEWLSFLYRYIPVGVLEVTPQHLNDRPPPFCGRSDLETKMASKDCKDWIHLSEMLLGPVPPDFSFLPKHKANSYGSASSTTQAEG